MTERFIEFTESYHPALEERLEGRGRDRFPYHGERMGIRMIFIGSDGAVTFYTPSDPSGNVSDGSYVRDWSNIDLDTICQALHLHRLKIASPLMGQPMSANNLMPPDRGYPLPGALFHPDIVRLVKDGKLDTLHGMTITPPVLVENGIQRDINPGRVVIWSPTVALPEIGRRRLYLWSHADFWWLRDCINLNVSNAVEIADADIEVLDILLNAFEPFTEARAKHDAGDTAGDILTGYCREFEELLDERGGEEETIHQWLKEPKHRLFLSLTASEIFSKIRFGNSVSDFVVRHANGRYTLVEIEAATSRIFRQDNAEPTAAFNHACQQVSDWQRHVREHVHEVRDVQKLPGIYEPGGRVIMGRSMHISEAEAKRRWDALKAGGGPEVFTYDEIIDQVREIAKHLREILSTKIEDQQKTNI